MCEDGLIKAFEFEELSGFNRFDMECEDNWYVLVTCILKIVLYCDLVNRITVS